MTNLENPAVTLRAAVEVIRTHGFTQHAYVENGAYCIVGALVRGAGFTTDPFDHVRVVMPEVKVLADLIGNPTEDASDDDGLFAVVTDWNDEEGRTSDDVIELLTRAADTVDPPRGPA